MMNSGVQQVQSQAGLGLYPLPRVVALGEYVVPGPLVDSSLMECDHLCVFFKA